MQIMDLASLAVKVSSSYLVGGNAGVSALTMVNNALETVKERSNNVTASSSVPVANGHLIGEQTTRVFRSSSVAVGNQQVAELLEQASVAAQGFLDTLKNPNTGTFVSNVTRDTSKGRTV